MLSLIARALLASSALAPSIVIIALLTGAAGNASLAVLLLALSALSVILFLGIMRAARGTLERFTVRPASVTPAGLGPAPLLCALPLLVSVADRGPWLLLSAVVVIAAVMRRPDLNLTLGLLGWSAYAVRMPDGAEYVLAQRRAIAPDPAVMDVGRASPRLLIGLG